MAAQIGIGTISGVGALIGGAGYWLNARTAARVASQAKRQHQQELERAAEASRVQIELERVRGQMRDFAVPASTHINAFWYGWCYLIYKVCPTWHAQMELSWFEVDGVPMFNLPQGRAWKWIMAHPVFRLPPQAMEELAADESRTELYCDWHRYTGVPLLQEAAAIVEKHAHLARWPSVQYMESVFPAACGVDWKEFTAGGVTAMLRCHFLA
jgi:hypothetical protein